MLATGIYLPVAEWGADAWILDSLASLVALASIGGFLTGVPMARIPPKVEKPQGGFLRSFGVTCGARSSRSPC